MSDTLVVQLTWASETYHHTPRFTLDPVDEGAYRIAFLGDSFTYGMCPREFTHPSLVERFFREGRVPGVLSRRSSPPSWSASSRPHPAVAAHACRAGFAGRGTTLA